MREHICVFLGLGHLNVLFSSSSHLSSNFVRSFFFTAQQHSTAYLHQFSSSIEGYSGCFYFLLWVEQQ